LNQKGGQDTGEKETGSIILHAKIGPFASKGESSLPVKGDGIGKETNKRRKRRFKGPGNASPGLPAEKPVLDRVRGFASLIPEKVTGAREGTVKEVQGVEEGEESI